MVLKLPTASKKHSISNSSDLFGTISYGRNLNLDEGGYIKLSKRVVSMFKQGSEPAGAGSLDLPLAFGRNNLFQSPEDSVDYAVVQASTLGKWFTFIINSITLNVDSGVGKPTFTSDSAGCWFKNLWHVTDDTKLYTKAGVADTQTYTDGGATLTTGKAHPVAVFEDLVSIAVGDGNLVKLYTLSGTTHTLTVTLTLPSEFEVIGLAYSNGRMGIITMLSDTTTGKNQNKEAQFFVWDGVGTGSQPGIPIGSSKGIAMVAYKGSWVILNREGQLLYFGGGGFTQLAALPFYYKDLVWGKSYSRDIFGDVMWVEGDLIYMNLNGVLTPYGQRYEQYLSSSPAGILCYDPDVAGIYHRYSPSLSLGTHIQVAQADVNTSTDIMTITAAGSSEMLGTIPSTGSPIKHVFDKTSAIGGVTPNKIYYCIKLSSTTFALATTAALAAAGTKVDLTSTGPANSHFFGVEVYDYGASYANRSGAVTDNGISHPIWSHLLFGSEINDFDGTGNSVHWNAVVEGFANRGYFVTPKMQSQQIQDKAKKVYVKYRTLGTNDSIIVKVKDKDLVGLPISTPQATTTLPNQCAWSSTTVFTTTADLSDAKTAYDAGYELECEVIAGAAAGTLTKISSITESGGTYTVTLSEAPDGAAASRYSDVVIDKWRVLGTISSTDVDGVKSFNVDSSSTWFKYKVELRGVETAVEEVIMDHDVHQAIA